MNVFVAPPSGIGLIVRREADRQATGKVTSNPSSSDAPATGLQGMFCQRVIASPGGRIGHVRVHGAFPSDRRFASSGHRHVPNDGEPSSNPVEVLPSDQVPSSAGYPSSSRNRQSRFVPAKAAVRHIQRAEGAAPSSPVRRSKDEQRVPVPPRNRTA